MDDGAAWRRATERATEAGLRVLDGGGLEPPTLAILAGRALSIGRGLSLRARWVILMLALGRLATCPDAADVLTLGAGGGVRWLAAGVGTPVLYLGRTSREMLTRLPPILATSLVLALVLHADLDGDGIVEITRAAMHVGWLVS